MFDYEKRCQERANFYRRNAVISSDKPNALALLKQKQAYLQEEQSEMKMINACCRKGGWEAVETLLGVDATKELKASTRWNPALYERRAFQDWELRNLNAQIKQVNNRIAELEKKHDDAPTEPLIFAGFSVVEEVEDNRIHLLFDTKPHEAARTLIKRQGFKWSPNRGAWIRMLNQQGREAAKSLSLQIKGLIRPVNE